MVVEEDGGLFLRDGCDLRDFYAFVLILAVEGEIEGLVGPVEILGDEVAVADQVQEKARLF